LTGEQSVETVVSDRVEISSAKMIDSDIVPPEQYSIGLSRQDCPSKLLENWMDLDTFVLVSGDGRTAVRKDYWTTIWNKIAAIMDYRYHYFRADIELSVTVFSSPMDYGSFVISWYPENVIANTSMDALNSDPWIFDLSTGGTHLLRIPYSSPYKGYNSRFGSAHTGVVSTIPSFNYIALPMRTLGLTFAPTVTVRGRFCNLKAWGAMSTTSNITFDEFDVVSQMNSRNTEGKYMPTDIEMGYGGDSNNDVPPVSSSSSYTNIAKNVISTLAGSAIAAGIPATVGKLMGGDSLPNEPEKDDHSIRNEPTFYGEMCGFGGTPMENMSFSMRPVSTFGLAGNCSLKLRDIRKIPCISAIYTSAAASVITIQVNPVQNFDSDLHVDYLNLFCNPFRFWRGSIDYRIQFHISPLMTARIVIRAWNNGCENNTAVTNDSYLFKEIMEVTGFTEKFIRIPFIYDYEWCPIAAQYTGVGNAYYTQYPATMDITVQSITSGLIGSAAAPVVPIVIIRRAGPDFQVRNFVGNNMVSPIPVPPEAVSQMRVRHDNNKYADIFQGNNDFMPPRPVLEDDMTATWLLRRWSVRVLDSNPVIPHRPNGGGVPMRRVPIQDTFDFFLNQFRYVRGCVDFKIPVPSDFMGATMFARMQADLIQIAGTQVNITDNTSSGYAITVKGLNPVLHFKAPIEGRSDWLITYGSLCDVTTFPLALAFDIGPDTSPTLAYVRASDDLQIAFLNPPPAEFAYLPRYAPAIPPIPPDDPVGFPMLLKGEDKGKTKAGWFR